MSLGYFVTTTYLREAFCRCKFCEYPGGFSWIFVWFPNLSLKLLPKIASGLVRLEENEGKF